MKDVVIISNYIHFKSESGNSRFIYLADKLRGKCNIEIVTSTFYHKTKSKRNISKEEIEEYNVKLIDEPGYKKNISIRRIKSNYIIAKNIIKYLKNRKKPDIIYCAVPPTTIGKSVAKFAKKNNIRFIIDIQDLWPEAYKMVFNIPIISDILYFPIEKQANYTYKNANDIVAVSDTYVKRALNVNNIAKNQLSVYLGTDLTEFDKYKGKEKEKNEEIKMAYLGTLGHSYDIKTIIDSIALMNNDKVKLVAIGDGVLRESFEEYAKERNINYEFTGNLQYKDMVKRLCECDIAVNPIKSGSAGSIINKVGDYAAAGLPIINTQECQEYRELVEKYNIGFNCKNGDIQEIKEKITYLINNEEERKKMGRNNRKLAEEKFDRSVTYNKIVDLILGD